MNHAIDEYTPRCFDQCCEVKHDCFFVARQTQSQDSRYRSVAKKKLGVAQNPVRSESTAFWY